MKRPPATPSDIAVLIGQHLWAVGIPPRSEIPVIDVVRAFPEYRPASLIAGIAYGAERGWWRGPPEEGAATMLTGRGAMPADDPARHDARV